MFNKFFSEVSSCFLFIFVSSCTLCVAIKFFTIIKIKNKNRKDSR